MGVQSTQLAAGAVLLNIFVSEMYIIRCGEQKYFQGWSERTFRGAKILSRGGVAMTSDSGRWFSSEIRGEIETRDPRAVILALSQKLRPAQRGRNREKAPTETAAVVTHCVFLLPLGGPRGGISKARGLGQLSVCIPWFGTVAIILNDSRSSTTLERLEQKRAGKASMKSSITRSSAALIA